MENQESTKEMSGILRRINNRKKELGYSYQDFADKTGLSKSTLQRYLTGSIKNVPLDKIETIATALETTPAYLMGWEDVKESIPSSIVKAADFAVKLRKDEDAIRLLEYYYELDKETRLIALDLIKTLVSRRKDDN